MKILKSICFVLAGVLLVTLVSCASPEADNRTEEQKGRHDIITPDLSGQDAEILILGNSFIGSSQIQIMLNSLVEENNELLHVKAVGEGFANVSSLTHHVEDDPNIKAGFYDAIFVCGFYYTDVYSIEVFLSAVEGTKTKIIMFPAPNEVPDFVTQMREFNEGTGYVGWLDIVYELLKNEGFSKDSLIENDFASHLKPLGGYAGAVMIYNYLYRKLPVTTETDQYMISNYGDTIPGDTEKEQQKSLGTIRNVAKELISGKRRYVGQTVNYND